MQARTADKARPWWLLVGVVAGNMSGRPLWNHGRRGAHHVACGRNHFLRAVVDAALGVGAGRLMDHGVGNGAGEVGHLALEIGECLYRVTLTLVWRGQDTDIAQGLGHGAQHAHVARDALQRDGLTQGQVVARVARVELVLQRVGRYAHGLSQRRHPALECLGGLLRGQDLVHSQLSVGRWADAAISAGQRN